MYAATSYVLRLATDADAPMLSHLADLDGTTPLEGSILIGELHGEPVAALSLRTTARSRTRSSRPPTSSRPCAAAPTGCAPSRRSRRSATA